MGLARASQTFSRRQSTVRTIRTPGWHHTDEADPLQSVSRYARTERTGRVRHSRPKGLNTDKLYLYAGCGKALKMGKWTETVADCSDAVQVSRAGHSSTQTTNPGDFPIAEESRLSGAQALCRWPARLRHGPWLPGAVRSR